jgi:hypothetical protein
MLHLSRQINTLRQRMEDENLERRFIIWKSPDFPHLDETELRNITCGVYQLKLSSSYMQEYLEVNSEIFVHQEDDTRSVTESPHIIQDIFVIDRVHPNGSYRMVLQMSSRNTSCWSMFSHRVHLVVPWICKAQTACIRNWGTLRRC